MYSAVPFTLSLLSRRGTERRDLLPDGAFRSTFGRLPDFLSGFIYRGLPSYLASLGR